MSSVYFDFTVPPEENASVRWRSMTDRLVQQGADQATIEILAERVSASVPSRGVLAAFVANGDLLLTVEMPGSLQGDFAMCAPLPYVLPLLAWTQDRPPRVLAVVDRTGADITAFPGGGARPTVQSIAGPDDEIERNAPGGWSQMRYQHRAEDSWQHNAARIADALTQILSDLNAHLLLLSGDVRALQYLVRYLPAGVRRGVTIRHVCGSRSHDGSRHEQAVQVEAETNRMAREETRAALRCLAEERSPSGGAVEGVHDTLTALARGRVRTLIVVDDPKDGRTAWFGLGPTVVSDQREALVLAAEPIQRARLADVAVRSAVLTRASVRVVQPGTNAPTGGIGALCRFPKDSQAGVMRTTGGQG
jgi:peptide subunit release factor 1 (eRF1)